MSAAWNSGRVLVPIDVTWADALIEEHGLFTGQDSDDDDQVDGCSQAWNVLYRDMPKMTEGDYVVGGM
jgi:phage terminase large subunit-like protein